MDPSDQLPGNNTDVNLLHEVINHEGKTFFKCNICRRTLSRKQRLESHLSSIHGIHEYNIRTYKRYLDDPSLPLPKSTKYDLKKRSASNVNCNDLNNVIPSQQAILNHPESSVCDITYTYSQETEAITHDDMGTLEISGSSLDGYAEAETFAEKEVDSEAWLGDNEPLVEDSNSECTEISLDLDSDSETSEIFSESEESEVSEENEQCGNSSVDVDDTTEHRILSDQETVCMAVLAYVSRHNLTNEAAKDLIELVNVTCPGAATFKSLTYNKVQEVCGQCESHVYDICEVCLRLFPLDDEGSYQCATAGCVG